MTVVGMIVIARGNSDEAIHTCFAARWIASRSLSPGARSRGPLARNDGENFLAGHSGTRRRREPQMCNCTSGNLEISGFDAEPVIGPARGRTHWHRPGMTALERAVDHDLDQFG